MLWFKREHGALWELIFFQNVTEEANAYFTDTSVLNINEKKRFSIIGLINERFRYKGYYEYLLEYPEYKGYIRWKQAIDIASTTSTQTSEDIGFKDVHHDFNGFKGLSRSTVSGATVFDGTPGETGFFYSIGAKCSYINSNQIAGVPLESKYPTRITYLWIRIPCNINPTGCNSQRRMPNTILLLIIILVK